MAANGEWTQRITLALAIYPDRPRRTLQHWVKRGLDAGDPPPLLDPPQMPAWWLRLFPSRDVPADILSAAQRIKPSSTAGHRQPVPLREFHPQPPQPQPVEAGHRAAPEIPPLPESTGEVDPDFYDANLRQLHRAIESARGSFSAATDPGEKRGYLKDWVTLSEQVRKMEKDWAKMEEDRGNLVKKAAVIDALHVVHGHLDNGVRSLYRRLCSHLGQDPNPQHDAVFDRLVDDLFGEWHLEDFGLRDRATAPAAPLLAPLEPSPCAP